MARAMANKISSPRFHILYTVCKYQQKTMEIKKETTASKWNISHYTTKEKADNENKKKPKDIPLLDLLPFENKRETKIPKKNKLSHSRSASMMDSGASTNRQRNHETENKEI